MSSDYIFDGKNVVQLAEILSTPFFLFSENILLNNFRYLLDAGNRWLPNRKFNLAYSIKNNSIPLIVHLFSQQGCLFEVTSIGEMTLLEKLGVPLSRCIYTNIWKPEETLQFSIDHGLGYFAVDSLSDMKKISFLAKKYDRKLDVLIRVNPSIDMKNTIFASATPYSKTGAEIVNRTNQLNVHYETAYSLTRLCIEDRNLNVVGLHGHLGSQVNNIEYYKEFSRIICRFYKTIESELNVKLRILDLGGGIPVLYRNTGEVIEPCKILEVYSNAISEVGITPDVILEIGRYLTSQAGILVTKIVAIKDNPNIGTIIITDGSAYHDLLDSVLVHWDFDMTIANKELSPRNTPVWVVGSTTDSIDAYNPPKSIPTEHKRRLQVPEEGDVLVILAAGAYTTCFNMNYCLRPNSPVYLISRDGKIRTARRKQTLDQIFENFSWDPEVS